MDQTKSDSTEVEPDHPAASPRASGRFAGALGVIALLTAVGVGLVLVIPARRPVPTQVILISIDTLRADHLGYAGYRRDTSPNIDRFAERSIRFLNAFSQSNGTLPSHATMFTSLYPLVHQANSAMSIPLGDGFDTLAEILSERGYETGAFVEGGQLYPAWNLDQGFQTYQVILEEDGTDCLDRILSAATEWIEPRRQQPFFCFIHTYVVHIPYWPRPPYDSLFREGRPEDSPNRFDFEEVDVVNRTRHSPDDPVTRRAVDLYDGEIRYMDDLVGRFLDRLDEWGLYDRCVVVFTSDHGEEFGEHGKVAYHGHTLFDELLRVPLLFRIPGGPARRIRRQVRLIDLAPTILGLLQIDTEPYFFQGRDLFADGFAKGEDLPVLGQAGYQNGNWVSLRFGGAKIHAMPGNRHLFFDLTADPGEQIDLFGRDPNRDEQWIRRLEELNGQVLSVPYEMTQPIQISPENEEQLRALGYIK